MQTQPNNNNKTGPSATDTSNELILEHESFLPVTRSELEAAFLRYLDGSTTVSTAAVARSAWVDFMDNLSLVVSLYYNDLTTGMKESWDAERPPSSSEEQCSLRSLDRLLSAAQYAPLAPDKYELAMRENYEFTLPTEMQWEKYDVEMLAKFYDGRGGYDREHPSAAVPQFARHVFIATRGSEVSKKTGFMFQEKINLLLEVAWSAASSRVQGARAAPAPVSPRHAQSGKCMFQQRVVVRESLASVMKHMGYLRGFFSQVSVKEPVFKDVIVVYKSLENERFSRVARHVQAITRLKGVADVASKVRIAGTSSSPSPPASPKNGDSNKSPRLTRRRLTLLPQQGRRIQIEEYQHIPFGDLEALFPFKKIFLRPIDTVKFGIQLITLAVFIAMSLFNFSKSAEEGKQTLALMCVLTAALAQRLWSTIASYRTMKGMYLREMDSWLETKRVAQGKSVVTKLADEVQLQETKEMLLGYFFLWQHGTMTLSEMDRHAERFLKLEFNLECDFEAEDALRKLLALRLVERIDGGAASVDAKYRPLLTPEQWLEKYPVKHLSSLSLTSSE
eukprot:PhM_4_TR12836/c0_g1_i1/m.69284